MKDEVHAVLTELLGRGGTLGEAPGALEAHVDDATVIRIAKDFRGLQDDVVSDGRAVVVSAGPPGAGKSQALTSLLLSGFRVIDPDTAKDLVLNEADRHGLLEYRHDIVLPDGQPVGLRELASHVHGLSTRVCDVVRSMALAAGENVIIDGTLSWRPLASHYIDELFNAGYEGVDVIDVEAPVDVALTRARGRWWEGRLNDARMGGRFIPDEAITACYPHEVAGESMCAANAVDLAQRAADELGRGLLRRFDVDISTGAVRQTLQSDFS